MNADPITHDDECLNFPKIDFGSAFPLPEGASEWEQQEANRYWRNAIDNYRQVAQRMHATATELMAGHANVLSHPSCNDSQHLAIATAGAAALFAHVQGVHHRLANEASITDFLNGGLRADGTRTNG